MRKPKIWLLLLVLIASLFLCVTIINLFANPIPTTMSGELFNYTSCSSTGIKDLCGNCPDGTMFSGGYYSVTVEPTEFGQGFNMKNCDNNGVYIPASTAVKPSAFTLIVRMTPKSTIDVTPPKCASTLPAGWVLETFFSEPLLYQEGGDGAYSILLWANDDVQPEFQYASRTLVLFLTFQDGTGIYAYSNGQNPNGDGLIPSKPHNCVLPKTNNPVTVIVSYSKETGTTFKVKEKGKPMTSINYTLEEMWTMCNDRPGTHGTGWGDIEYRATPIMMLNAFAYGSPTTAICGMVDPIAQQVMFNRVRSDGEINNIIKDYDEIPQSD